MAAASQPCSSRASQDSTNTADGAETATQCNAWPPPLEVTDYCLEEWPNSNNRPTGEHDTTNEVIAQMNGIATPAVVPRSSKTCGDPPGSRASVSSENRNPFLSGYTQPKASANVRSEPAENQQTTTEENPLRYIFRTPPVVGPKTCSG